jgi:anaerobic magnesium-protoporphyrin IX monomethyl ester cyclase
MEPAGRQHVKAPPPAGDPQPVCLIRPRAGEAFRFSAQSLSLPLGLAYLAAALEQAGHSVAVLDAVGLAPDRRQGYFRGYLVGLSDDELVARVPAGAAVIGVSVLFTHEWPAVVRLLSALRRARPGALLVLGGEHVTAMPEFCLLSSAADVAVLGEGEETLVELLAALRAGRPLADVTGIAFRTGAATPGVRVNPRRARLREVDSLPRPAWRHFDVGGYAAQGHTGGVGAALVTLPVLATRGCPYQCTYCTNPGSWGTEWIARDPVAVVDEMEDGHRRFGARNFPFQDLTAVLRRDWILRFCDELIARRLDVRWQMPTGTRLEAVDAEVAARLRASGMVGMAFAPESGSAATRALVKKRMTDAHLLSAIEASAGAGLNVALFIVLGFPHDTPARLREELAFSDRARDAGATELSAGFYMALPGTELFDALYDAGRVTLDRAWFGHVLQSTTLWPSRSWCPSLGRARLFWWSLRLYARFFLRRARRTRPAGAAPAASATGTWAKLPAALRFAARSAWHSLAVRLRPGWCSRSEESALFAGWDALYRDIRRQQLAGGAFERAPEDLAALQRRNVTPLVRRAQAVAREVALGPA